MKSPPTSFFRLFRWLVLIVAPLAGIVFLARLDFHEKISTDITDLIPQDKRSAELRLVNAMMRDRQIRVVLLTLRDADHPGQAPAQAAAELAAQLARSPAFADVETLDFGTSEPMAAMGRFLYENRFNLLFPGWLARQRAAYAATGGPPDLFPAWAAQTAARHLDDFYATPTAMGMDEELPGDPLLLLPDLLDKTIGQLGFARPESAGGSTAYARVWAQIAASPFVPKGQDAVSRAINDAFTALQRTYPSVRLEWTGVNKMAAASKQKIRTEITWLNGLSLGAVFVLSYLLLRKPVCLLHLVPPVGLAILGAWVFTLGVFPRIQMLVLVIGSILTGITIDYGFHVMLHPRRPGESFREVWNEIGKPLLASCLTTVAGFLLLTLSRLPVIRQIGLFVAVGLVTALVSSLWYFSLVRVDITRVPEQWHWIDRFSKRGRQRLLFLLLALALLGLIRLPWVRWNDDIRALEMPQPALMRENRQIRQRFGDNGRQTAYLSYGRTDAEARAALQSFLDEYKKSDPQARPRSLADLLPAQTELDTAYRWAATHPGFADEVIGQLNAAGYRGETFAPFAAAYRQFIAEKNPPAINRLAGQLERHLPGPVALLMHSGDDITWFLTLGPKIDVRLSGGRESGTVAGSQLESLNAIFTQYRISTLRQGGIGLAVVTLGILLIYGWKQGVRIMAVPLSGGLAAFGVMEMTGRDFGLFNLLGVFLGIGIALDYALFYATASSQNNQRPTSVLVSALTTIVSFVFLSFSSIPVVSSLGLTVCLLTGFSLLIAELGFPVRAAVPPADIPSP